jgi:acetyl esterase/lipase
VEISDVQAAMRWIADNADTLGINAEKIAYAGVSAGAALVSAAAVRANNQGEPTVFAVVSVSSPYEITRCAEYLDADDPPFYMIHGTGDSIVNFSQAEDFAAALDSVAVPHVLIPVGDDEHPVDHFDVVSACIAQDKANDPFIWLKGLLP